MAKKLSPRVLATPAATEDLGWLKDVDNLPALTVNEAASRCLMCNPNGERRDQIEHNKAVDLIKRALVSGDLKGLPHEWPAAKAAVFYENVPMLRPARLAAWGARFYPKAFTTAETSERPLETKERHTHYRVINALKGERTPGAIKLLTEKKGDAVSERAIRDLLSAIDEFYKK